MFFAGLAYGAIGDDVESLIGDSETSQEMFVQSGTDVVTGFYGTSILMLAVICCGFAISSALRPRAEEDNGHLEVLLATALPRTRWLLGHVVVTVGGVALVLVASGLGLGAGYLLVTGDGDAAWDITWPVVQYVAPVLVLSARRPAALRPGAAVDRARLGAVGVRRRGDAVRRPLRTAAVAPGRVAVRAPADGARPRPSPGSRCSGCAGVAVALSVAGQVAFARRDVH